jgi:hypothetical protein
MLWSFSLSVRRSVWADSHLSFALTTPGNRQHDAARSRRVTVLMRPLTQKWIFRVTVALRVFEFSLARSARWFEYFGSPHTVKPHSEEALA